MTFRDRTRAAVVSSAAVLTVSLAIAWSLPEDAFWIADNGNKALVAERLLHSRFRDMTFDYPGARFDPASRAFPIRAPFAVRRDGHAASVWLPFYPAASVPFRALLGRRGLVVPAALGVAAASALTVWWLGPFIGAGAASASALSLSLATPLLFYGVTVWEHSLAVALALGAFAAMSNPTTKRLVLAGVLLALGCAFRSELALLGIAVALATFALRRRPGDLLALALGAAPVAGALVAFQLASYGSPIGPHVSGTLIAEAAEAKSESVASLMAWARAAIGLFAGFGTSAPEAVALATAGSAAITLGAAAAALRGTRRTQAWVAAVVALAIWAYGFGRIVSAHDPLTVLARFNGLMIHLPLACLAGAGLVCAWRDANVARLRPALLASVLFLLLGIGCGAATRYSSGLHWGPRFLLPAFPALVALAIIAARSLALMAPLGVLVAASLASTGFSVWLLAQQMSEGRRLAETLLAQPEPAIVTSHALLPQQLAQLWDRKPMLLVSDPGDMASLVRGIEQAGERSFLLLIPPGAAAATPTGGARCELRSEHRGRRVTYLDVDVLGCRIGARVGRF